MIKRYTLIKKVSLILLSALVVSCNDDVTSNETAPKQSKMLNSTKVDTPLKLSLDKLGYKSYDELKSKTQLLDKSKDSKFKTYADSNDIKFESVRELITEQHLIDIRQTGLRLLKTYIHKAQMPLGVNVNDYVTGKATLPKLSETYGWYAYFVSGKPKVEKQKASVAPVDAYYSAWVFNESDKEETAPHSYTFDLTRDIKWTIEGSLGFKLNGQIKLFIVEGGIGLGLGGKVGLSGGESQTMSISSSYNLTIPPKTKRKVIFVHRKSNHYYHYEIPVRTEGLVGANFLFNVGGQNQWSLPADRLLDNRPRYQRGYIDISQVNNIEVYAEQPVPINEDEDLDEN